MKNILVVLFLLAVVTGCDDSSLVLTSPPPSGPTPPLVLSLSSPVRLADYDAETFLVSDYKSNAIHFTDKSSLEITRSVRVNGQPTGIAHSGGLLYVGNKTTGSVDVLNLDGEFQFYLGGTKGLFQNVLDVAIDDNSGLVFVLDSQAARVSVYQFDGTLQDADFTTGGLVGPSAIAIDLLGQLYVSDYGAGGDFNDQSIKQFNSSGALLGTITSGGGSFSAPAFSAPQGQFVDAAGNLFVVDSGAGEIFVYDNTLSFITSIGERGTDAGQIFYPLDLFIDATSKDIYVADNQNGRVTVYLGAGVLP